jgi:hypothetical protein
MPKGVPKAKVVPLDPLADLEAQVLFLKTQVNSDGKLLIHTSLSAQKEYRMNLQLYANLRKDKLTIDVYENRMQGGARVIEIFKQYYKDQENFDNIVQMLLVSLRELDNQAKRGNW